MFYFSTNNHSARVDFKEATVKGQAPDKGLYFPANIPAVEEHLLKNISEISLEEIAFRIIKPYVGDTIPGNVLQDIVAETINFDFPLVKLDDNIYSLELFHGPTLAFKDVGARFMSRCLGYFVENSSQKLTVLVATSGDTGGAVAHGFYNVEGINVIILYPKGKVSRIQELQLTTLKNNVTALEVNGDFDDCQTLVKEAFADVQLNKQISLTSANSINVARWLPQQFYYYFAYRQWATKSQPPVIAVPSGNFGNICAGLLAHRAGLPVKHFIAACNANKVVPDYLQTGSYLPREAVSTISNAMDVGNPSNFVRIMNIFNQHYESLRDVLTSYSISDELTAATLKEVYKKSYLLDPHGAVAYSALKQYLGNHPGDKGIFLETAHPVKFLDVVEPLIDNKVPIPGRIQSLLEKEGHKIKLDVNYDNFKEFLLMQT